MPLFVTQTIPGWLSDNGPPQSTYVGEYFVNPGQPYFDSTNGDIYICYSVSDQGSLSWFKIPRVDQIPDAQIKPNWNQSDAMQPDFIQNKPPARTQTSVARSLNTGFQVSLTRDAMVNYSVDISCLLSLTVGETGTLFLEIANDSNFSIGLQELARFVNGAAGSLSIGLNLNQTSTATVSGFVPAGSYVRLRAANTVGSPQFLYRSGQEVLL